MKRIWLKILLIAVINSLSSSLFAQYLLPDHIQNVDSTKSVVWSQDIRGGYHQVADKDARDSISIERREVGMAVTWGSVSGVETRRFDGTDTLDVSWENDLNWTDISGGSEYDNLVVNDTLFLGEDTLTGETSPAGSDREVQFNDNGSFGSTNKVFIDVGSRLNASTSFVLGDGTNSDILLNNSQSGNQLILNPYSGSFNSLTFKLGALGSGLSEFITTGPAFGFSENLRLNTGSSVASIYCNNSNLGLGLNGTNTVIGHVYIEDDGDVGIGNGTGDPDARLHIEADDDLGLSNALLIENDSDEDKFIIKSDGELNIFNSSNDNTLTINEDAKFTYGDPTGMSNVAFSINVENTTFSGTDKVYFNLADDSKFSGSFINVTKSATLGNTLKFGGGGAARYNSIQAKTISIDLSERDARQPFLYGKDELGIGGLNTHTGIGLRDDDYGYQKGFMLNVLQDITNSWILKGGVNIVTDSDVDINVNQPASRFNTGLRSLVPSGVTFYNNDPAYPFTLYGGYMDIQATCNNNVGLYLNVENADNNVALEIDNGLIKNGGFFTDQQVVTLNDNDSYVIPASVHGWGEVMFGDDLAFARFRFSSTALTSIVENHNTSQTDVDNTFQIRHDGTNLIIKNTNTAAVDVLIKINYK